MRKNLRILILIFMRNKLIISTFLVFALTFSVAVGQDFTETKLANANISLKPEVSFYPNPAIEFLIVEVSADQLKDAKFEMHSIIGNEMKIEPEKVAEGRFKIKVKDFAPGYYFLVVKDDKTHFSNAYKFLKN